MSRSFLAVLGRDLRLAARRRVEALLPLAFFGVAASLFPLGVGPEPQTLRQIAPGVLWVCALLAAMLSVTQLYAGDHADGSLEQMLLVPGARIAISLAKAVSHWLLTGLPLIKKVRMTEGQPQNKDNLWGGENTIIDLAHHALEAPLDPRESDPLSARQIPYFRTDDLDTVMAALSAQGVNGPPVRNTPLGREGYARDPMGRLIGFRQPSIRSPLAADREARRRRLRGEAFNPGCAPMPPHVQELGWVRITVADLPAMVRFYADRLGLPLLEPSRGTARGTPSGPVQFDLGDNITLELVPGGRARTAPAEQRGAESVIILRVAHFDAIHQRLRNAGQSFPYPIYDRPIGAFSYIADPEGNLMGLADRRPPAAYMGTLPVQPEDLEAQRRWVESRFAARPNG